MLEILTRISGLLSAFLPILVSIGVIYFIWGVIRYVIADDEEAKQKGKDRIIFGIIGLAVIISVWGLVFLLADTFGSDLRKQGASENITKLVATNTTGACDLASNPKLQGVLNYITCIIGSSVVPLLFAIAVVAFIWGAIKFFIIDVDEEAKREQGRQFMLWGIIALAVMISVWGLVKVLAVTFGIDTGFLPKVKP